MLEIIKRYANKCGFFFLRFRIEIVSLIITYQCSSVVRDFCNLRPYEINNTLLVESTHYYYRTIPFIIIIRVVHNFFIWCQTVNPY